MPSVSAWAAARMTRPKQGGKHLLFHRRAHVDERVSVGESLQGGEQISFSDEHCVDLKALISCFWASITQANKPRWRSNLPWYTMVNVGRFSAGLNRFKFARLNHRGVLVPGFLRNKGLMCGRNNQSGTPVRLDSFHACDHDRHCKRPNKPGSAGGLRSIKAHGMPLSKRTGTTC